MPIRLKDHAEPTLTQQSSLTGQYLLDSGQQPLSLGSAGRPGGRENPI
jgi:hypothetical protein